MAQLLCLGKVDGPLPSPYDFVAFPPPFDTSDDDDNDEDRFFAGLTRRLTQSKSFAGVPSRRPAVGSYPVDENHESTFTGTTKCFGPTGFSQFRVPPPADTEWLSMEFRAGAHDIASLRMASQEHPHIGTRCCSGKQASPFGLLHEPDRLPWTQNTNHDPFSLPRRHAGEVEIVNPQHDALLISLRRRRQQQQVQSQMRKLGLGEGTRFGRTQSFPHPGWTPSMVGPYGNGSVPSRGCAGTGVFLPRGYGEVAPESRRKSGIPGGSPPAVIVPAKVARALNLNVHHLQDHGGSQLATRDAALMQERGSSGAGSLTYRLPQDWTY
ncbi:hypothetical protein MLD38_018911 [Melastoma candidum]|uniref:Uncharacterized protein n=1 Tax=Melastoma candidum TaxID=119954 RepID=A0ACB9QVD3_9MYRT|nr:hypothetical protein MLD38_018911 [Melastoma candidum]